jgi:hypothetical protein
MKVEMKICLLGALKWQHVEMKRQHVEMKICLVGANMFGWSWQHLEFAP